MRLIDARYIINRITEERRRWGDDYDVEQVLGDIEDAPTIDSDKLPSANQWIPCSERLPEEDKDVLITYQYQEGEGDRSHSYCDITTYGDGYFGGRKCSFKEWRAPFEYFHSNYEVVAWMPLPDPWKGEEE